MVEKVETRIYLMAGLITIIVFTVGIAIGYSISSQKYNSMSSDLQNIQVQQKDLEIELLLINTLGEDKSCDTIKYEIDKTANQSVSLGEKVSYYDQEIIKNPDFFILKKNYIMNLIQFWSYWELYKNNCNSTVNTVLYFYSIKDCQNCDAQGYVLSFLKDRYPSEIMTFALDKDEDLYSLDLIKKVYNISSAPTLIVNNKKYESLMDVNQLKSIMTLSH
jgi:hypothetical protein